MIPDQTLVVNAIPAKTTSIVASARMTRFVALQLRAEILDRPDSKLRRKRYRTVVIINSPWQFSAIRERVTEYVDQAKRMIYVENDYAMAPTTLTAISRWMKNNPGQLDYWTTRLINAQKSPRSRYVNWNALFYVPATPTEEISWPARKKPRLFYYGALRKGRDPVFREYFGRDAGFDLVIASSLMYGKRFKERFPHCEVLKSVPNVVDWLQDGTFTIYVEDERATKEFYSLACRFYEAVSAGIFQLVDARAVDNFKKANIPLDPEWVVGNLNDVVRFLRKGRRHLINQRANQILAWRTPKHRGRFRSDLRKAIKLQTEWTR